MGWVFVFIPRLACLSGLLLLKLYLLGSCSPIVSVAWCATLFRAFRAAAGGDGMRKKDTEIPSERAFV
jgi:hypothetical protein